MPLGPLAGTVNVNVFPSADGSIAMTLSGIPFEKCLPSDVPKVTKFTRVLKPVPVIVTVAPVTTKAGLRLVMAGGGPEATDAGGTYECVVLGVCVPVDDEVVDVNEFAAGEVEVPCVGSGIIDEKRGLIA